MNDLAAARGLLEAYTTKYPDGVPADLATSLRVTAPFSGVLRPILSTMAGLGGEGDPGGAVYEGPINDAGVDAGKKWRVKFPELVLCLVEQVAIGAGTNGGRFAWSTDGPGGTLEYATNLSIVHKQIDSPALANDRTKAVPSIAAPASDPFCFLCNTGRVLPGTGESGAGGVLTLPVGATGVPLFTARFEEDLDGPAEIAGRTIVARIEYAYRASPWPAPTDAGSGVAVTSDGSNTGTGQFRAPGGAVPPGLRKPTDVALSASVNPASGTYTGNSILKSLGVDVAVIDGGYLLGIRDGIDVSDAVAADVSMLNEFPTVDDDVSIQLWKGIEEEVAIDDTVEVETNPPILVFDNVTAEDDVDLIVNP